MIPASARTDTDTAVGEPCRALELNRGHVLTGEYQLIGCLEHRSCCLSSLLPGLTSALLLGLFLRDVVVHVHVGRTDEREVGHFIGTLRPQFGPVPGGLVHVSIDMHWSLPLLRLTFYIGRASFRL